MPGNRRSETDGIWWAADNMRGEGSRKWQAVYIGQNHDISLYAT